MADSHIPVEEWSGSGATRELQETIRQFNEQASRQTRQLVVLTWVIAGLTLVIAVLTFGMTVGVVVQICLAAAR